MDPDRTIKTTATGRRAAALRDGRHERGQEPTRPLMIASAALPGLPPLPWTVDQLSQSSTVRDGQGRPIATVALRAHVSDPNVAAVLAAAPTMLVALEGLIRLYGDALHLPEIRAARAAIAQARGRS